MYVTPILLLLLASNAFAVGNEDWQALFSSLGINTNEISCVVQNFKVNLDTLMSLANKQQNEVKPEASGDGVSMKQLSPIRSCPNSPELTPLAGICQAYQQSSSTNTFWGAQNSCLGAGKFVTPNTDAKMECLREQLRRGGTKNEYWIGANNVNRPFFYWVTTNEIAYLDPYWATKPSGLPNQCVYISAVDGLLRDGNCGASRRYICETA